jgi:glycosyltransferase involved in cell wall biosynthesis
MIVKNEAARIVRCLASVAPHISSYAILDTGSTDGTERIIREFFEERAIPGIVGSGSFRDFSQARNDALKLARATQRRHPADFFLLVDADMELKVADIPDPFGALRADAPAYTLLQCAGGVSYDNTRLLNTKVDASYRGATHEYLDVAVAGRYDGATFIDYADGSNRENKAERDIALLLAEIEKEPENPRSWFYLGNSYMDIGKWPSAEFAYKKRIAIGGWNEEVHNAKVKLAHCLNNQGVESQFVAALLDAYNFRPQRAEVLYELAKHFREKPNQQQTALLFCRAGYKAKRPDDMLFVPDWVYNWGFREEYSILGGYGNDNDKKIGAALANGLALDPSVPPLVRHGARQNLRFYAKPLVAHCPSFTSRVIDVKPQPGYTAMNPSVAAGPDGSLYAIVRTVNYRMDDAGRYLINGPANEEPNGSNPIDTRNIFVGLSDGLLTLAQMSIEWQRPAPAFNLVTGLEDMRLFYHHGFWMATACIREQVASGTPQQVLCQLDDGWEITEWKALSDGTTCEKNWMPIPDEELHYAYRLDTIRAGDGMSAKVGLPLAVDNISGGSPLIRFKNGWLAIVHEAIDPGDYRRNYIHRWAWFNEDHTLRRLSLPFHFHDRQIEFAAGLAMHPNGEDLVISYGVRDCEARIARVAAIEVSAMLSDFYEG